MGGAKAMYRHYLGEESTLYIAPRDIGHCLVEKLSYAGGQTKQHEDRLQNNVKIPLR